LPTPVLSRSAELTTKPVEGKQSPIREVEIAAIQGIASQKTLAMTT